MADIKGILFNNGSVVYAKVADTGATYELNQPIVFRLTRYQDDNGNVQEGLQPQQYLPTSDDVVVVQKTHVTACFTPVEELVTAYQQATGSIITPPTQSILLG